MNLSMGIAATLALMHMVACAAPASGRTSTQDYSRAIDDAAVVVGLDRKSDLRRCVNNWSAATSTRVSLLREVFNVRKELKRDSVLLEIGSSGFPRYDYIYVENGKLRSSFNSAVQLDIAGTAFEGRLHNTLENELTNLAGRASSTADDASCYFLSIKKGSAMKSVAIYGKLDDLTTDSFIKDLLAAAGRRS